MLRHMELCNWPPKHVDSFARFYLHLELDLMRSRPNGGGVLLAYQAKVWRQWHDNIAWGQGFNIAQINQRLLASVAEEVWDAIRLKAMRKVSTPLPFDTPGSPSLTNSLHTLPISLFSKPCHCHCHNDLCHDHCFVACSCRHHHAIAIPCVHAAHALPTLPPPSFMPMPKCHATSHTTPCHCLSC